MNLHPDFVVFPWVLINKDVSEEKFPFQYFLTRETLKYYWIIVKFHFLIGAE
ncbi:phosphatidylserine decarboxylase [Bacillus sp. SG-1]|nr:phosphatidylserine decarboxylase [Bacillus sp. SG-1]